MTTRRTVFKGRTAFNLVSIIGVFLRPVMDWYEKRNPCVIVTLHHHGREASARIATFGQPVFVRSVRFEVLLKEVVDEVVVNQMIQPHSQVDYPLTRKILSALVLTVDITLSASYKTASGREANSESYVFNITGGDGSVYSVKPSGKYLSFAACPKCGDETMFSNTGVTTKRELEAREKAFKKDLSKTCPDHESSRVKFWC